MLALCQISKERLRKASACRQVNARRMKAEVMGKLLNNGIKQEQYRCQTSIAFVKIGPAKTSFLGELPEHSFA